MSGYGGTIGTTGVQMAPAIRAYRLGSVHRNWNIWEDWRRRLPLIRVAHMLFMDAKLEKIHVQNFKGLKDLELDLGQFNVLIGSNGSGKTSVLEAFKFIRLCIDPAASPTYPFNPWWGFGNLVWSGNEELAVSFSLEYSAHGTGITYDGIISGAGGSLSFLNERCDVKDIVSIERDSGMFKITLDEKFAMANSEALESLKNQHAPDLNESAICSTHQIKPNRSVIRRLARWLPRRRYGDRLGLGTFHDFRRSEDDISPLTVCPMLHDAGSPRPRSLYRYISSLLSWNDDVVFLRHLNFDVLRRPVSIDDTGKLAEDGDGLVSLLFLWYHSNDGELPDGIVLALEDLFPGWRVVFELTADGRAMLTVKDGDLRLAPPSIPDGFYKLLAILAAVELNPRILLIDEVDTSLHAKVIDYVLDTLKTSESTVIITTHSPLVIDMVDLEDLIVLEHAGSGISSRRIRNPDDLRMRLKENGLTASESWIYAEI